MRKAESFSVVGQTFAELAIDGHDARTTELLQLRAHHIVGEGTGAQQQRGVWRARECTQPLLYVAVARQKRRAPV